MDDGRKNHGYIGDREKEAEGEQEEGTAKTQEKYVWYVHMSGGERAICRNVPGSWTIR